MHTQCRQVHAETQLRSSLGIIPFLSTRWARPTQFCVRERSRVHGTLYGSEVRARSSSVNCLWGMSHRAPKYRFHIASQNYILSLKRTQQVTRFANVTTTLALAVLRQQFTVLVRVFRNQDHRSVSANSLSLVTSVAKTLLGR